MKSPNRKYVILKITVVVILLTNPFLLSYTLGKYGGRKKVLLEFKWKYQFWDLLITKNVVHK